MDIPLLAPHTLLAWLDADHLIVEDPAAPQSQVLIGNAKPGILRWLRSCDGSRSLEQLLKEAPGLTEDSARELLDALQASGLLSLHAAEPSLTAQLSSEQRAVLGQDLDALALSGATDGFRRRQEHHIWIDGANRVAHALLEVLGAAHVGSLQVRAQRLSRRALSLRDIGAFGPQLEDVGTAPTVAMRRHLQRIRTHGHAEIRRPLIIACDAQFDPSEEVAYQEAGLPYLRVLTGSRHAVIGPLTLPGHSVCWSCMELHRSDADPEWPRLLAQFDQSRRSLAPVDSQFAMWVASETASQVLRVIDSDDPTSLVNTTLHMDRREWVIRRRSWQVHPDCPCQWRAAAAA
ncbi:MAG: hypothetical protein ACYC3W_07455 [Candidatus Nanopelagicales bacterium]